MLAERNVAVANCTLCTGTIKVIDLHVFRPCRYEPKNYHYIALENSITKGQIKALAHALMQTVYRCLLINVILDGGIGT